MNSKHAKFPCCGARVRRFGPRRRQCVQCRHTWTIRPRKRGRPAHRTQTSILHRVLVDGLTLGQLFSKRPGVALPAYRYRFRQALRRYVARPSPQKIPGGPLVLLADGLWFEFGGIPWVLYLMALKPCRGNYAIFLDPLLFPGKEGALRWHQAFAAIPPGASRRIQAMVVEVRELLNGLQYYRAYLMYPQLGLPQTTNTVESMCRLLRELLRSSRAGSNPASVLLWATALIRMRPRVVCNGHSFNRIN